MAIFEIRTEDLLAMPSQWRPGYPRNPLMTVGEIIEIGFEDFEHQEEVTESIRTEGQKTPVAVVNGELADGHHRAIAAVELGLATVLATDGADGEWDDR